MTKQEREIEKTLKGLSPWQAGLFTCCCFEKIAPIYRIYAPKELVNFYDEGLELCWRASLNSENFEALIQLKKSVIEHLKTLAEQEDGKIDVVADYAVFMVGDVFQYMISTVTKANFKDLQSVWIGVLNLCVNMDSMLFEDANTNTDELHLPDTLEKWEAQNAEKTLKLLTDAQEPSAELIEYLRLRAEKWGRGFQRVLQVVGPAAKWKKNKLGWQEKFTM